VSTAAITVAAEKVIDSPTLVTDQMTDSRAAGLGRIRSRAMLPPTPCEPG
jgi:hypothetical protein